MSLYNFKISLLSSNLLHISCKTMDSKSDHIASESNSLHSRANCLLVGTSIT